MAELIIWGVVVFCPVMFIRENIVHEARMRAIESAYWAARKRLDQQRKDWDVPQAMVDLPQFSHTALLFDFRKWTINQMVGDILKLEKGI